MTRLRLDGSQRGEETVLHVLRELRKITVKDEVEVDPVLSVVVAHGLDARGASAFLGVERRLLEAEFPRNFELLHADGGARGEEPHADGVRADIASPGELNFLFDVHDI